jgi:hypothetical protein
VPGPPTTLKAWTLKAWTLKAWTLKAWTLKAWTLKAWAEPTTGLGRADDARVFRAARELFRRAAGVTETTRRQNRRTPGEKGG